MPGMRRLAPAPAVQDPHARALVRSKVMDAGFYGAQVGKKFANRTVAAEHYVAHGAPRLQLFHPLINPRFLPEHARTALREGDVVQVLEHLFSPRGVDHAWSTLLDPRELAPAANEDRVEAVRAFFRDLGPETVLPPRARLRGAGVTWGAARPELVAAARLVRGQRALNKARISTTWDADAERRWLEALPPVDTVRAGGPLVSVVMPVWNRADRVLEAIASVREQTLTQWELVVVDDGSTDGSLDVVRAAARDDVRIVVVAEEHQGVSAARNAGLQAASGRYVAFLDSDNSWRPHFLSTMVAAMQAQGLRAAYSGVLLLHGDEAPTYRAFRGGRTYLMAYNHIDLNVLVVDAGLARGVGGFDASLRRWVDHDFALKVAATDEPVLLPFIGCDYDDADGSADRITTTEHSYWQYVVLGDAHVDWAEVRATLADRVRGRVSVVMPTFQDYSLTTTAVAAVVEHSQDHDVEIVVVDNGSHPHVSLELAALAIAFPQMVLLRLPRNLAFAIGSNVGLASSTGELVCFLNNDTAVRAGWLGPLVERLGDADVRGVQPLLVYPDDTVQTAGTVFPVADTPPIPFLAGHPPQDARVAAGMTFHAVSAAALLMRADELAALRGFDPRFVNGSEDTDLCLRAERDLGGHFVVETTSVVTHKESRRPGHTPSAPVNRQVLLERWRGSMPAPELGRYATLGLDVVHIASDGEEYPSGRPVVARPRRAVVTGGASVPSLRWSIKNAATAGPRGDEWGDTHFIEALGEALQERGQEVVTARHGAHVTPAAALDDVNLVIRGLDRVQPHPGQANVLWVISHPDDVTVEEVRQYDLVFAASAPWAAEMSRRSGRDVRPLLQATDPERFRPASSDEARGGDVVFVGQARLETPRAIVMDTIAAGLPVKVWGPRWEMHIGSPHHQGSYLPNGELGPLYRRAGFVLNDHWADMASAGFVSNRVFDAVASGARVISDPVDGMEEMFGGAVQVYRGVEDLARLVADDAFPDAARRAEIAESVRVEHTFAHRAEQLLEAVLAHRAATGR